MKAEVEIDWDAEVPREIRSPEDERLRDQFAGHALTGLLAGDQSTAWHPCRLLSGGPGLDADTFAAVAYQVADAMLRARKG